MHLRALSFPQARTSAGAWQSINGEVYEGGLGQVYGLDIQLDQGPEQLFIRVAPLIW